MNRAREIIDSMGAFGAVAMALYPMAAVMALTVGCLLISGRGLPF
jgi:hypothetical protein